MGFNISGRMVVMFVIGSNNTVVSVKYNNTFQYSNKNKAIFDIPGVPVKLSVTFTMPYNI